MIMVVKRPKPAILVLVVLLITNTAYAIHMVNDGNSNTPQSEEDTECHVLQKYKIGNWSGEPIGFLAYMENVGTISFRIEFEGPKDHLTFDKLLISPKGNSIYQFVNGNVLNTPLKTCLDVVGWTRIEIGMTHQQVIVKYWDVVALNYTVSLPVEDLYIWGSNITICGEKTPTWTIEQGFAAKIPLEPAMQVVSFGNRTHALTLRSNDEFTPCIIVDGHEECLSLGGTFDPSPLPAGRLELFLEIVTGFIKMFQKVDGRREYIASFPKQGIKFIEIKAIKSKISASLDVFVADNESHNYTIIINENMPYWAIVLIIGVVLSGQVLAFFLTRSMYKRNGPYWRGDQSTNGQGELIHSLPPPNNLGVPQSQDFQDNGSNGTNMSNEMPLFHTISRP